MTRHSLTDQKFWQNYWFAYQIEIITPKYFDLDRLSSFFPAGPKKFIEIGGFPGAFSIYFRKFKGYEVTLLDYVSGPEVFRSLAARNGLSDKDIEVITADVALYPAQPGYDVVFSAGFIEHFSNPEEILRKHCDFLKQNGVLLAMLPNFGGLNGYLQRIFDKDNYRRHSIDIMDINKLAEISQNLPLTNVKIMFHGRPRLWLEKTAPVPIFGRYLVKFLSFLLSFLPFKNRFLSPFIVVTGIKTK